MQPLPVRAELPDDVAVRDAASFQNEAAPVADQVEHLRFDQSPTEVGEDPCIGEPTCEQFALLGPQPAQVIGHGARF
jgi:hypothetical protein